VQAHEEEDRRVAQITQAKVPVVPAEESHERRREPQGPFESRLVSPPRGRARRWPV
jgi:hypothetical protein